MDVWRVLEQTDRSAHLKPALSIGRHGWVTLGSIITEAIKKSAPTAAIPTQIPAKPDEELQNNHEQT
jgi:hypothetical protein